MHIIESEFSCGVKLLDSVGQTPNLEEYTEALENAAEDEYLGCFLLASVPANWKNSVKFLKSVGFKKIDTKMNPNSGNMITLLSKTLSAKERKKADGNRCKECGERIEKKRRVCDECKVRW